MANNSPTRSSSPDSGDSDGDGGAPLSGLSPSPRNNNHYKNNNKGNNNHHHGPSPPQTALHHGPSSSSSYQHHPRSCSQGQGQGHGQGQSPPNGSSSSSGLLPSPAQPRPFMAKLQRVIDNEHQQHHQQQAQYGPGNPRAMSAAGPGPGPGPGGMHNSTSLVLAARQQHNDATPFGAPNAGNPYNGGNGGGNGQPANINQVISNVSKISSSIPDEELHPAVRRIRQNCRESQQTIYQLLSLLRGLPNISRSIVRTLEGDMLRLGSAIIAIDNSSGYLQQLVVEKMNDLSDAKTASTVAAIEHEKLTGDLRRLKAELQHEDDVKKRYRALIESLNEKLEQVRDENHELQKELDDQRQVWLQQQMANTLNISNSQNMMNTGVTMSPEERSAVAALQNLRQSSSTGTIDQMTTPSNTSAGAMMMMSQAHLGATTPTTGLTPSASAPTIWSGGVNVNGSGGSTSGYVYGRRRPSTGPLIVPQQIPSQVQQPMRTPSRSSPFPGPYAGHRTSSGPRSIPRSASRAVSRVAGAGMSGQARFNFDEPPQPMPTPVLASSIMEQQLTRQLSQQHFGDANVGNNNNAATTADSETATTPTATPMTATTAAMAAASISASAAPTTELGSKFERIFVLILGFAQSYVRHDLTEHSVSTLRTSAPRLWDYMCDVLYPGRPEVGGAHTQHLLQEAESLPFLVARLMVQYVVNSMLSVEAWMDFDEEGDRELRDAMVLLQNPEVCKPADRQAVIDKQSRAVERIMSDERWQRFKQFKTNYHGTRLKTVIGPLLQHDGEARRRANIDVNIISTAAMDLSAELFESRLSFQYVWPDTCSKFAHESHVPFNNMGLPPLAMQLKQFRIKLVITPGVTMRDDRSMTIAPRRILSSRVLVMN